MIALEKVNESDIRQVVTKRFWSSGTKYEMYRHDYSRTTAKVSGIESLFDSFLCVKH